MNNNTLIAHAASELRSAIGNAVSVLEKKAIAAADEKTDAASGREFLSNLTAKWYEQGYNYCDIGGAWDEFVLFSPEHQQGYIDCAAGVKIDFSAI
jgi:hypothetical protein